MQQCGMFNDLNREPIQLSQGLQLLKSEHGPLNEAKAEMNNLARDYAQNTEPSQYKESLLHLRTIVTNFFDELHVHSEKEEGYLFKMMEKYIGKESGPLVVMEYEHDEAKRNIHEFLAGTENITEPIQPETFEKLLIHVMTTYDVLTSHFMKEEQVLFPMAEQYLTEEEKELLLERVK